MSDARLTYESYLTPKAQVIERPSGLGVVCIEPIAENELVAVFGGVIISYEELMELPPEEKAMVIQVGLDEFSYSKIRTPSDYINHSCDPNLVFDKLGQLVAWTNIEPDTELMFDYGTADATSFDDFECQCGTEHCRGMLTGNDWRLPEVQEKYAGRFMPFLQQIIAQQA